MRCSSIVTEIFDELPHYVEKSWEKTITWVMVLVSFIVFKFCSFDVPVEFREKWQHSYELLPRLAKIGLCECLVYDDTGACVIKTFS